MDQNKKTVLLFLLVILFSGLAIISGSAAFIIIDGFLRSSVGSYLKIVGGSWGEFNRFYYGIVLLVIILILLPILVIITNIMGLSFYKKKIGIKRTAKYISVSSAIIMIIYTINIFGLWILRLNTMGDAWNSVLISLMLEIIINQIVVIIASSKNKKLGTNTKNG